MRGVELTSDTSDMRSLCTIILLSLMALKAGGTAVATSRKDPVLTINGVGLGTEIMKVLKTLGPPISQVDNPADDMPEMGEGKTLKYDGLVLELCKPEGHTEFYV